MEQALLGLARKAFEAPRLLTPGDLGPLRGLVGDAAIDYVFVLASFHFINRIADLLEVDPEALPASLRRFEFLRRMSVRVAALLFRGIDLRNRDYGMTFQQVVDETANRVAVLATPDLPDRLGPLSARPRMVEVIRLAVEERDERSELARELIWRVQRGVEAALPAGSDDVRGFHPRPADPVDAFVFVGTRYAQRTTMAMIESLRGHGFDDLGILDLAIAVADANQWARAYRLLGLDPTLYYLKESATEQRQSLSSAG